jgi:plastocyanin
MGFLKRRLRSPLVLLGRLFLLVAILCGSFGQLAVPVSAMASEVPQEQPPTLTDVVISYTGSGFTPRVKTIRPGDTIIWRNTTAAPLALKGNPRYQLYLPLLNTASERGAVQSVPAAERNQFGARVSFEATVQPGAEFSFTFTERGTYTFFSEDQPDLDGTINVLPDAPPPANQCEEVAGGVGEAEVGLTNLFYATEQDRTLLRWYWDDCTTAKFAVYRSANGGPEQLLATVAPVTDPTAATALLDTTDPRWPDLSSSFKGRLLHADSETSEQYNPTVTELYHYLYTNGLAAVQLTNRYYPLALMLGWGYLDTAVTPGTEYTYRVVVLENDAELGTVVTTAGKPTPLPVPTQFVSGTLEIEPRDGDWSKAQRNRRHDRQIYLNWNTGTNQIIGSGDPAALVIGYDVFEATRVDNNGRILNAVKVVPPESTDNDAIVVPGPKNPGDTDYLFRYAPEDYDPHTFCVAPRDLFNRPLQWPTEADRCSEPITVKAQDFQPPAPIGGVHVTAGDVNGVASLQATRPTSISHAVTVLAWARASDPGDVSRIIVQRTEEMHCTTNDCWQDMATLPGDATEWEDPSTTCANDPLEQKGCWYRVFAVDAAGNRSAPSQAVYALMYDTEPPTLPNIDPYTCDNSNPNARNCIDIDIEPEPASVRVNCVLTPGGDEIFIAEVGPDQYIGLNLADLIRSVYLPPMHLMDVRCRIILADVYGNLSDLDDSPEFPVVVLSDSADQLAKPVITNIETIFEGPGNWAAGLRWDIVAHPVLGGFEIERTRASDGNVTVTVLNDEDLRSFTDTDVEQDERYTYVVRATAAAAGVNETVSEPRDHRILTGEDRELVKLPWVATFPQRDAATASAELRVSATPLAAGADATIYYAVFRSLRGDRDFTQITPILQRTGSTIVYTDSQAQRCYYYTIVTFHSRDGEPSGYSQPEQPGLCAQAIPPIYAPGPDLPAPPAPGPLCAAAQHSLDPGVPFRFGGGFEIIVESLEEGATGPARVDGAGWLLLNTATEAMQIPISFEDLRVDATGRVCTGTVVANLSGMTGGGLHLQAPGGWRYVLREISLQPWFDTTNHAMVDLDLLTGNAFTNFDSTNAEAQRIALYRVPLLSSLRFSYSQDFGGRGGNSCIIPEVAFRLETLPLDVIPNGQVTIDEYAITMSSACTRYVDRYTSLGNQMATPPNLGGVPQRSMNDGYLRRPLLGNGITLGPNGLDGSFNNTTSLEWYTAYPYAMRVQINGGINLTIEDNLIISGSTGPGNLIANYHQRIEGGTPLAIASEFDSLTIGSRGDMTASVSLLSATWDGFGMYGIPANSWTLYLGALTTPAHPAYHDADAIGRSIMWQPSPTNATPVPIPGGALPGLLEPGLNRRQPNATLTWDNCGDLTTFGNVAVDAYLRLSGLTQRLIPVYDENSEMAIYGYRFLPERFDLHFIDNALLDHNITGRVDLPFPSDIQVQLIDVWLTGNPTDPTAGEAVCIGGGNIPAGDQDKTLAYWDVDTHLTTAEFRPLGGDTRLWFAGELRNLPHLTIGTSEAPLPTELALQPDGSFHAFQLNYNRPDYRFQGFPYLLERLRLSDWYGNGQGQQPDWEPGATLIEQPDDAIWNANGFVGLRGVPVAPYFGPIAIAEGPQGDNMTMAAWNPTITGFAAMPSVSKEWVKLARVNITFDYEELVHAYDLSTNSGMFVDFKAYRFVPDQYAVPIDGDVADALVFAGADPSILNPLQVLQLDTGVVIEPTTMGVYLGLSSGVAVLRALDRTYGGAPGAGTLLGWADRLNLNEDQTEVYLDQYELAVQADSEFVYQDTTDVLDGLTLANLRDQMNVGGRTQGWLALRGVNFRRLRGIVEIEGEGLEAQFSRFQLSTQVKIMGREQAMQDILVPDALEVHPELEPDPPLFYAERMTLVIERHGDFVLAGKNVQSSTFKDELDSFDATLVINTTKPQLEGGLTLYGLKAGNLIIDNGAAVLGIGADLNYLGLSFDARLGMSETEIEGGEAGGLIDEIKFGGDLLAGVINTNSLVLQSNFADAMEQITGDLEGVEFGGDPTKMAGFYVRAYVREIPIIGNGCVLNLKGDAEIAFWYWKLNSNGENLGGLLKPAVYGEVLCAVQARGALHLEYQFVNLEDRFIGEGYVAGGVGLCDPSSWGSWNERWWGDSACLQAGAGLSALYSSVDGWSVDYGFDRERIGE